MSFLTLFVGIYVVAILVIVIYLQYYPDYRNSKSGVGTIAVPTKRDRTRILDTRFGGMVEIIEYTQYGLDKKNYKLQTSDGIINHIYYDYELIEVDPSQVLGSNTAPLYVTISLIEKLLNTSNSNSNIERSDFVSDLRNRLAMSKNNNDLLIEENTQLKADGKRVVNDIIENIELINKGKFPSKYEN